MLSCSPFPCDSFFACHLLQESFFSCAFSWKGTTQLPHLLSKHIWHLKSLDDKVSLAAFAQARTSGCHSTRPLSMAFCWSVCWSGHRCCYVSDGWDHDSQFPSMRVKKWKTKLSKLAALVLGLQVSSYPFPGNRYIFLSWILSQFSVNKWPHNITVAGKAWQLCWWPQVSSGLKRHPWLKPADEAGLLNIFHPRLT